MSLDCTTIKPEDTNDGALRWAFNSASAGDMRALGAAFARVVAQDALPPHLRIGLCGTGDIGKSTFTKGLLNALPEKISVENNPRHDQNVWHMPGKGWIRHYDCMCGRMGGEKETLSSYWKNDLSSYDLPVIDIVEHPHKDRHDTAFDGLVFFARESPDSDIRRLTVAATPELAQTAGFQEFLKRAQPMVRKAMAAPLRAAAPD
jgi:hypothetical protein